jgi:hypothetical protein
MRFFASSVWLEVRNHGVCIDIWCLSRSEHTRVFPGVLVVALPGRTTKAGALAWKEVAVHQNGQTVKKEVRSEKRWLAFIEVRVSHLFSHGCHS